MLKICMMTHISPPEITSCSQNQTFKNPRWRTADILKIVKYDISETVQKNLKIEFRLSSFARRAFSVAGPSAWNWLPEYLRDPAPSAETVLENSSRRLCMQRTNAYSALEVPRLPGMRYINLYYITLHLTDFGEIWCGDAYETSQSDSRPKF